MSHKEDISIEWKQNYFMECLVPVSFDRLKQVQANSYLQEGKYPVVDQGQNLIAGWTNDESKIIKENLPIIIFGDHTRVFKYVDFPFALGADGTKLIKPKQDEFSTRFFYYYLLTLNIPERGYNRHYKLLKEQRIRYPSLTEQWKIAAILYEIHKAIEIQESNIEKTRELKNSTLHHVFTHDLRGGEKTKETEIGPIPESWSVQRFEEFATLHRGYDLPIQDRTSGSVPIVGSNGVVGYHDQSKVKGPGVVTGRSGSIGISYYVADDYWPLNTGLYVEDFHGNDPLYVHYFFQSFNFGQYAAGVSVPTLNRNLVHAVLISAPPIIEQKEIANIFKAIDQKIDLHIAKKSALQVLFKTMLNKLMTGEIRVKDLDIDNVRG